MKVIEKGNEDNQWSKQITCTGAGYESENGRNLLIPCGSKLEINLFDINVESRWNSAGFDNWEEFEYYCICPECASKTKLSKLDTFAKEYALAAYKKAKDSSKGLAR